MGDVGRVMDGFRAYLREHNLPITAQRLKHFSLIWPDGRPHALIAKSDRQAPFLREPRYVRVVRSDRRSFRVYEGGRTDAPLPRTKG